QRVLALVEPTGVGALAGELAIQLGAGDVPAHGHEVAGVLGEQIEPFLIAPLVQQLGLAVQEVLDLVPEEKPPDLRGRRARPRARSAQLLTAMSWLQRR